MQKLHDFIAPTCSLTETKISTCSYFCLCVFNRDSLKKPFFHLVNKSNTQNFDGKTTILQYFEVDVNATRFFR